MKMNYAKFGNLFLIILFTFCLFSQSIFCQEGLEENTTYHISVNPQGSATWVIERRFILSDQEEVSIFQSYISDFETRKQIYLEEFQSDTENLVERASLITTRSMSAENFDVTVGLLESTTASYGIIKFQYDWIGFAKIEEERIVVGDVFEGGFYLYTDDALIVEYPNNYDVQAVSPLPDEERKNEKELLWYGRLNFGAGEPTIILASERIGDVSFLENNLLLIFVVVFVGLFGFVLFLFFRKGKVNKKATKTSLDKNKFQIKSDQDRVVELLREKGGQLYQSMITKKFGFSKAKTSILLKGMEEKGLVKRKKTGREVIVTLLE